MILYTSSYKRKETGDIFRGFKIDFSIPWLKYNNINDILEILIKKNKAKKKNK